MDIYGAIRSGNNDFCPFLYQGQYYDKETGLAYNRFRYYSPDTGMYISQDPIGLAGNNPNIYAYVEDSNSIIDVLGLSSGFVYGLHPPATDVGDKGVHFGSHALYPDGSKVEVSIRPDYKGGVTFRPSHPGKVKKGAKYVAAFEKGVKEIEGLLTDPKVRAKVINQIDNNLFKQFPDKGMEWKMLKKAVQNMGCS